MGEVGVEGKVGVRSGVGLPKRGLGSWCVWGGHTGRSCMVDGLIMMSDGKLEGWFDRSP